MAETISSITVSISHRYRHRWLGLLFAHAMCLPHLVGLVWSDKAADRLAVVATSLMGMRVFLKQ